MAFVTGALVIVLAAFVKGAVAFGFPVVATPLLTLVFGVKTAVAVSILPNIVMDGLQLVRRGDVRPIARRFAPLIAASVVGMWLGTYLLALLPGRVATMVLGVFVLVFAAVSAAGLTLRVSPAWERWLSPPIGVLAGVLGGLTNVPGTTMVIYFVALGLDKHTFVKAVALSFIVVKVVQLIAVSWYGFLDLWLLAVSVAFTAVGVVGFAVGLRLQEWLPARAFNRAVLGFLVAVGVWLLVRSL